MTSFLFVLFGFGQGSFGFVFKGMWLDPQDNVHHEVAVKVMSRQVRLALNVRCSKQLHSNYFPHP